MNVQTMLQELDSYFQKGEFAKVEPFLLNCLNQAQTENDKASALTILNELMGFYRSTSRFSDSLAAASKALGLMELMGLKGSVHYATTLLNVATAYRADGQTAKAIEIFEEVGRLFTALGVNDVYLLASLYNNLSLAWQECGEHDKAISCLEQALPLIKARPGSEVDVAVSLTNLSLSKIKLGRLAEASADLVSAVSLFESKPRISAHYSAALAALGEIAYKEGRPQESVAYYERALRDTEARYGKNMNYAIMLESLALVFEDSDREKSQALQSEAQAIHATLK